LPSVADLIRRSASRPLQHNRPSPPGTVRHQRSGRLGASPGDRGHGPAV